MTQSAATPVNTSPTSFDFRWWHGFAVGLCVLIAPSLGALAALMAMPIGLAVLLRRQIGYDVPRVIAAYTAVAFVHPAFELWRADTGWAVFWDVIARPETIVGDWGAALLGWLIYDVSAATARLTDRAKLRRTMKRLSSRRLDLEQEWGLPPDGRMAAGPQEVP